MCGLLGAPVPDHVVETFHRGRLADNSRMGELLGFTPANTTVEVVDKLYAWPSVVRVPPETSGGLMADEGYQAQGHQPARRTHHDLCPARRRFGRLPHRRDRVVARR